jgi:pyruvate/2-oxoglutarate dehydrogenase complex dihydrolipoamide acyltransferase (E2) component
MTSAAWRGIVRAMSTPSATIWRRRVLLMLAIGLVIAVPMTLILRGSDDGEDGAATTATAPPSLDEALPLKPSHRDQGVGVAFQVPKGWQRSKEASAIRLTSPDRAVQIGISSPGPAADAGKVRSAALADVRSTYHNVDIARGSGKKVGGLRSKGAVISAKTPKGTELKILVAVAAGAHRTHLVEVFTAAGAPVQRIAEAQRALDSLRFSN